jgi:hypothetical protein
LKWCRMERIDVAEDREQWRAEPVESPCAWNSQEVYADSWLQLLFGQKWRMSRYL